MQPSLSPLDAENRLRALHDNAQTLTLEELDAALGVLGWTHIASSLAPLSAAADAVAPSSDDPVTLLWRICAAGNVDCARFLLDRGFPVGGPQGPKGTTLLYVASQNGHVEVCRLLVDHGADVEDSPDTGATPLFVASQGDHLAVVELLLKRGASAARANSKGCTPFVVACGMGHAEVACALFEHGAGIEESYEGRRALSWARDGGHHSVRTGVLRCMARRLRLRCCFTTWRCWSSRVAPLARLARQLRSGAALWAPPLEVPALRIPAATSPPQQPPQPTTAALVGDEEPHVSPPFAQRTTPPPAARNIHRPPPPRAPPSPWGRCRATLELTIQLVSSPELRETAYHSAMLQQRALATPKHDTAVVDAYTPGRGRRRHIRHLSQPRRAGYGASPPPSVSAPIDYGEDLAGERRRHAAGALEAALRSVERRALSLSRATRV